MTEEIKRIVEKTYIEKDYGHFISRCHGKIEFIDELLTAARTKFGKADVWELPDDPCVEIHFDVSGFAKNDFKIRYTSVLSISKIVDAYYLQHEFEVDNPDPDSMEPFPCGFGDVPYCKLQYDLEETVCGFLSEKGFKRLSYAEREEVIPEVEMPQNELFGTQMTVEYAVFKDMWGLGELS